jgi:GT2 family glycosyltransferase/2-polyprenyl-3-methyl-5-hydroxy-6-metoxy-1,4-benzoquinol methylase
MSALPKLPDFDKPEPAPNGTKYGAGADFTNPNTSHARMLALIGENKSVLEFGCSTGYMSRALKERGCRVTGVEFDPNAARAAAEHCERVITADVDSDQWISQLGDTAFDVAVFGDVLEHLFNPLSLLRLTRHLLERGGYVVASVPNIAHGSVRLALLAGKFEYRDLGLLDDTHIRFFTRETLGRLFADAGFRIDEMQRSTAGIWEVEIKPPRNIASPRLIAELEQDEDALTYQFVCKATPIGAAYDSAADRNLDLRNSLTHTLELQRAIRQLREEMAGKERDLEIARAQLAVKDATLNAVLNSRGWKLLDRYRMARLRTRQAFAKALRAVPSRRRTVTSISAYQHWIEACERPAFDAARMLQAIAKFSYTPKISIVTPVYNTRLDHLQRAVASVKDQVYGNWELCICDDASPAAHIRPYLETIAAEDARIRVVLSDTNEGISGASNRALALASGEFVGLLDHDDELAPNALFEAVNLLQDHPEADVIYSDEDKLEPDGTRSDPFFKPDWSPEYLLSCMYTCHFGVYRKEHLDAIGGFRRGFEGSQDYDLMLRISELTRSVFHVPKVLYHWRKSPSSTAAASSAKDYSTEAGRKALAEHFERTGIPAIVLNEELPNRYRVKFAIKGEPLISIIIPTKDSVNLLKQCIDSIDTLTDYRRYEVLVVDNNSGSPRTKEYFSQLRHRVVPFPEPFNFSRINNHAVRQAKGDYLVFLNNDTEVISREWLTAMLEFCQFPDVGVVGAKLLFPNNTIQHAGVVLGLGGIAGHGHKFFPAHSRGYFDSLFCTRNCSAVTAACMMVRRDAFAKVGGFDENLSVAFNDVDFCIRIRRARYRIVWTPYALLYHHESVSRGYALDPREVGYMQQRWAEELLNDPYYNPNLTLQRPDYGLRIIG